MALITPDAVRIFAVVLGGISFGISLPVIFCFRKTLERPGATAATLFGIVHLMIVVFVAGVFAHRFGYALSWLAPLAIMIFTMKITTLVFVREFQLEQDARQNPPSRRVEDKH